MYSTLFIVRMCRVVTCVRLSLCVGLHGCALVSVRVHACVHVCVRMRACVSACVRACLLQRNVMYYQNRFVVMDTLPGQQAAKKAAPSDATDGGGDTAGTTTTATAGDYRHYCYANKTTFILFFL